MGILEVLGAICAFLAILRNPFWLLAWILCRCVSQHLGKLGPTAASPVSSIFEQVNDSVMDGTKAIVGALEANTQLQREILRELKKQNHEISKTSNHVSKTSNHVSKTSDQVSKTSDVLNALLRTAREDIRPAFNPSEKRRRPNSR
ncbi:hypothetical protein CPLU01_07669 [Colletotrichum plurivorum]|uniref:Uncharacterized protein n=1 Tax=Colletotrichum plurivorum TaxID=2175906 RepID=A0A8H6NEE9_9PEZI|nr:hypothetical protein CPLU01_07669 [Colletotrichum plurivorum]